MEKTSTKIEKLIAKSEISSEDLVEAIYEMAGKLKWMEFRVGDEYYLIGEAKAGTDGVICKSYPDSLEVELFNNAKGKGASFSFKNISTLIHLYNLAKKLSVSESYRRVLEILQKS